MTDADECVVAVGIAVADTSEEAHELVVIPVAAHRGVMVLVCQERAVAQVVPEEGRGREVGVRGIEAVVLIIEIAVAHDGVEAVVVPLGIVARGQFEVLLDAVVRVLAGRAVVALAHDRVVSGRSPVLAVGRGLAPREHQVGLPALDRLHGDVAHQLREADAGIAEGLVLQLNGVVVLQLVEVLVVAAVGVIDGFRWVADDGLTIGVVGVGIRVFLTGHEGIDIKLQNVVPHKLGVVELHLEVLVVGIADDTLLLGVAHVGRVGGVLRAATDVQVVVVLEAGLARDGVEPVCVVAEIVLGGLAVDDVMGVHEVGFLGPLGEGDIAIIGDRGRCVAFTGLGGDDDHTVGTARTVDSGCRGILQHVDRGDVLRSHSGQVALDAIHQDERCKAAHEGRDTTQTDAGGGSRTTAGVDHRQTGNLTFHQFGSVADLTGVEVLGLHGGYGRGDITLALGAVTDDDHLVQEGIVFLECHVAAGLDLLRGKADVADDEGYIAVSNSERVVTVEVGNRCVLGALLSHRGADDRLALGVLDNTLH